MYLKWPFHKTGNNLLNFCYDRPLANVFRLSFPSRPSLAATNKLVKISFSQNDFLTELNAEIKLRSSKMIAFPCLTSSCILINGENFGSTRGGQRKHEDYDRLPVRPCPKACFHFSLFFAPYFVNLESHSIITRWDLHASRETASLSRSALKVSLLFLPISRSSVATESKINKLYAFRRWWKNNFKANVKMEIIIYDYRLNDGSAIENRKTKKTYSRRKIKMISTPRTKLNHSASDQLIGNVLTT